MRMKKIKICFVIFIMIITTMIFSLIQIEAITAQQIQILAKSAILIDQDTGNVLFEYNSDEQRAPASMTKIMALNIIMENIENGNIKEDEILVCSEHANSIQGSQIWLDVGEKMSVVDLLKGVIIGSANDATIVFAERIAGTEENFVKMMNEKAASLNMQSTHFSNCTGFKDEGNMTTARDVAIMSRELMKHKKMLDYTTIWMDELRGGKTKLVNTNRLIRFYPGTNGVKTGMTNAAGYCLSASVVRDGLSLISVVMGCENSEDRFEMSKMILNYGFDNFINIPLPDIQKDLPNLRVEKGEEDNVGLRVSKPEKVLVEKGKENSVEQKIEIVKTVKAPVVENQVIGKVMVCIADKKICEYPILTSKEVKKIRFISALKRVLLNVIRI